MCVVSETSLRSSSFSYFSLAAISSLHCDFVTHGTLVIPFQMENLCFGWETLETGMHKTLIKYLLVLKNVLLQGRNV